MAGNPRAPQKPVDPELGAESFDQFLSRLIAELGVKQAKAFEGASPQNDFTRLATPSRSGVDPRLAIGVGLLIAAFMLAR